MIRVLVLLGLVSWHASAAGVAKPVYVQAFQSARTFPALGQALMARCDQAAALNALARPDLSVLMPRTGADVVEARAALAVAGLLTDPAAVAEHGALLVEVLGKERALSFSRTAEHVARSAPADQLEHLRAVMGSGAGLQGQLDALFDGGLLKRDVADLGAVSVEPGAQKRPLVKLVKAPHVVDSRGLVDWHNKRRERRYAQPPSPSATRGASAFSDDASILRQMREHVRDLIAKGDEAGLESLIKRVDDARVQRLAFNELAAELTPVRARFIERMIKRLNSEHGLALALLVEEVLLKPAWRKKHARLIDQVFYKAKAMADNGDLTDDLHASVVMRLLVTELAPEWGNAVFVKKLLDSRLVDEAIARDVLTRPFARRHPEWVETLILRTPGEQLDLQFLGEKHWKPLWVEYWNQLLSLAPENRAAYMEQEPPPYRQTPARRPKSAAATEKLIDLGSLGSFRLLTGDDRRLVTVQEVFGGRKSFLKAVSADRQPAFLSDFKILGFQGFALGSPAPRAAPGRAYVLLPWLPGKSAEAELAGPRFWSDPLRWRRLKGLVEALASQGFFLSNPTFIYAADGVWRIADFDRLEQVDSAEALSRYKSELRERWSPIVKEQARLDAFFAGMTP